MGFLDNQRRRRHERSVDWDELVPLLLLDYELELAASEGGSHDDQIVRARSIRDQVVAKVGEANVRRAFVDADFELHETGEEAVIARALEASGYALVRAELVPETTAPPVDDSAPAIPLTQPAWPEPDPPAAEPAWPEWEQSTVDFSWAGDAATEDAALEEGVTDEAAAAEVGVVEADAGKVDVASVIPGVGARDTTAFKVAERALDSWLERFPDVARQAQESDGSTKRGRVLAEAYTAATATRLALEEGDEAAVIFDDQQMLANAQTEAGMTREWVVAFMQIRCIAIGYMLSQLGRRDMTSELGRLFREFFVDGSGRDQLG